MAAFLTMKNEVPEKYREEYEEKQAALFKARTGLFILTATVIYFLVSFFYLLRDFLGLSEAFRLVEFYNWGILLLGSALLFILNASSPIPNRSKLYGHLFNVLLIALIARLGLLYPANALIFPFYFSLALVVATLMIPWPVREVYILSGIALLSYSMFYADLVWIMNYPVPALSRFHPYFDGMLFILISMIICVVLTQKRVEREIENFVLLKEVEEKSEKIRKDLEFATRIQRTLVPEPVKTERAEIAVCYLPVSYIGGDYARFHFEGDDFLIFLICDVTGHGVAAALLVNRIHAEFQRLAREETNPGALLKKLDDFIQRDFAGTGMYLSAFCGGLDFKHKIFSYVNYGHPPQYLYQASRAKIEPLASQTTLLGIESDRPVSGQKLSFEKGDRIFLFTDGVIETANALGEAYGGGHLENFISKHHAMSPSDFHKSLLEDLSRHNRGIFKDDVFLLSIRIR